MLRRGGKLLADLALVVVSAIGGINPKEVRKFWKRRDPDGADHDIQVLH